MTNKLKVKKYLDKKTNVKIYRTIKNKEANFTGFILAISKEFMLIQTDFDFRLDGYTIIRRDDFSFIRNSSYEKTQTKIYKSEGLLNEGFGFDPKFSIESWKSILTQLKELNFHVIIESDNKKVLNFHIGQIVKTTNKSVFIHNYDPNGILDKMPTKIKFKKIRTLKFDDNYSKVFRKYLKNPTQCEN